MQYVSIYCAAVLLSGCTSIDDQVRREFLAAFPTAVVTGLTPGEGDAATVYYHIRYRLPPGTAEVERIWGYQRSTVNKGWRLFSQDSGRVVRP